jgi:DNA-binding GntR family transcriptional regulator
LNPIGEDQPQGGGAVPRVIEALRDEIMSGRYPVGASVRERDVVERFGVSRTPAREAIAHLVAIGLLEKVRNSSARVVGPSWASIVEAYAIREQLEPHAAELTVASGYLDDPDVRARLDQLHQGVLEPRSAPGWGDAHAEFHLLLVSGTGMPRLERLTRDLRDESRGYINVALFDDRFAARAHQQHDQMYQLAVEKDGKRLRRLLARHLADTLAEVSRAQAAHSALTVLPGLSPPGGQASPGLSPSGAA